MKRQEQLLWRWTLDAVKTTIELAYELGKPVVLNPAPFREISKELLGKTNYINI